MAETTVAAFDRDGLARLYANRHLKTDAGVSQIHYLPTNAPPREIRLLEVNRLISEFTDIEPIDFGVDTGSDNAHTLYVLDVTPLQWDEIGAGRTLLPPGWTLEGSIPLAARRQL